MSEHSQPPPKTSPPQGATLLATIALLALLYFLFRPAFQTVDHRGVPVGRRHLKQVGLALHYYLGAHGTFPEHPGGSEKALYLLKPYVEVSAFDLEPVGAPTPDARWDDRERRVVNADVIYVNRALTGEQISSTTVVGVQKATRSDGRMILLGDGTVRWVDGPPGPAETLFERPFTD